MPELYEPGRAPVQRIPVRTVTFCGLVISPTRQGLTASSPHANASCTREFEPAVIDSCPIASSLTGAQLCAIALIGINASKHHINGVETGSRPAPGTAGTYCAPSIQSFRLPFSPHFSLLLLSLIRNSWIECKRPNIFNVFFRPKFLGRLPATSSTLARHHSRKPHQRPDRYFFYYDRTNSAIRRQYSPPQHVIALTPPRGWSGSTDTLDAITQGAATAHIGISSSHPEPCLLPASSWPTPTTPRSSKIKVHATKTPRVDIEKEAESRRNLVYYKKHY